MSEKLRLQEPIRSPLETPRLITPLPYRSGTSFLAWAIVNNNQPVPDVFSKMTKIAASGRLGLNERGLRYRELKPCFLGLESLGVVGTLHDIKRMISTASQLTTTILEMEDRPVKIDLWPRLKEVGNLNFEILMEIIDFLHLTPSKYSTKKLFIDETLISTRNKIAHGEKSIVDVPAIASTINQTIDLINIFKIDVENAVSEKSFLRMA